MDALADLFSARNLPKPCAWDDISACHLEVMDVLMGAMHKGLGDATLEVSRLILKPESMKRFRSGEMLDDHCLDRMLEYLVKATGSKMVGVKDDATCSPWVTTDSNLGSSHYVLGIMHAESLRRLAKNQNRRLRLVPHPPPINSTPMQSPGPFKGRLRPLTRRSGELSGRL